MIPINAQIGAIQAASETLAKLVRPEDSPEPNFFEALQAAVETLRKVRDELP